MSAPTELSPIAQALGRIPTGLYVVTTQHQGAPVGFVGSFVTQLGFQPPSVCVAIGRDRLHLAAIRACGAFGVSILDKASQDLMGRFFRKYEGGATPFDGAAVTRASLGSTVFDGALAWLECKFTGEHALGDHVVVFGTVVEAKLHREGEPSVHLRKNGLGY